MRELIISLLDDLDAALLPMAEGEHLDLYHIGRSALVWEYGFLSATRDIDVLRFGGGGKLIDEALRLFGKGTQKGEQFGIYLDAVDSGFPPIPGGFRKRAKQFDHPAWKVIRFFHLNPNDLAVTKLKRFSPKDREDVRQLCDLELIDTNELERTLERAFPFSLPKDGDPYREAAFASLKIVQSYLRGEIREF